MVLDLTEQERLVRDLGDNNAMILRNHGLLTVGTTIAECFNALHRLELSCKTQIAAMSCNSPMIKVPDAVVEKTWLNYQPQTRRPFGVLDWPALAAQAGPHRSQLPRLMRPIRSIDAACPEA